MPQAKKRAGSGKASDTAPTRAITREELEQATARFERALEEAGEALRTIRGDLGKGAQRAYKDVAKALKSLRRDAQKTNKGLVKDLDKLRVALAAAKEEATPAAARKPAARRKPAATRTAASKPGRTRSAPSKPPAPPRSA
jgi:uncharacterized membrane protein YccC